MSRREMHIKTIIMFAATIIALIILYEILKSRFHKQYYDVSAKRDGEIELTQRGEKIFHLKVY